jgi:hypothetical protein
MQLAVCSQLGKLDGSTDKGAAMLTMRLNSQRIDARVPEQNYSTHPYRLDVHTR